VWASKNPGRPGIFHKAIAKYGIESFELSVLEECEGMDELVDAERRWIAELETLSPKGYNLTTGGDRPELTTETKARMSAARLGRKRGGFSDRHRQNMARAAQSHWDSLSGEQREARRLAIVAGVSQSVGPLTPEHKKKISDGLTGLKRPDLAERQSGDKTNLAKLSWEQVRAIREEYSHGQITLSALATKYGVTLNTIARIIRNESWKDSSYVYSYRKPRRKL
jgi:group I intron endonuclease